MLQRRFEPKPQLFPRELAVGSAGVGAKHHFAMLTDVLVERNLIGPRAPPPPSLAVSCLIHDDAEDPGAERRLAAKPMKRAKDSKKNFLRKVERFFAVAEQVRRKAEHEPVVLEHQGGVGGLVARQAPLDESGFGAGDFSPSDSFSRLDAHAHPRI